MTKRKGLMAGKIPRLQFIWWPFVSSCGMESYDDEARGREFHVWYPYFDFRRLSPNTTSLGRIYAWSLVLGYLEVRRWR
jgi:hypothetical protein